ncbi:acyl-CoA dehydrogenase family protein [Microbacterium sp. A82]|uniref:acyl-CoA dehydrogenase family protein n=1 Tax=Microbacterium sp. A82 TaxID=3450452 RepID=UPI003F416FE4
MDLSLSEEQRALRDMVRSIMSAHAPAEGVSDVLVTEERYSTGAEEALREAGLSELSADPRENLVELGVVLSELGHAAHTGPFAAASSAALTAQRLLGDAAGEVSGLFDEGGVAVVCDGVGLVSSDAGALTGGVGGVEWADGASLIVVAADAGDGVGLWTTRPGVTGVNVVAQRGMDGSRSGAVHFDGAQFGEPMAFVSAADWRANRHLLALLRAADLVGVMRRVLEMTVAHVGQREQFGKFIGQFQAVQHHLSNLAIDTEAATNMVNHALWRGSQGLPFERFAAEAAWFVGDAGVRATQVANQLHGGIGFMKEYHLHHFHNRSAVQRGRMGAEQRRLADLGDVVIEATEREFRDEFVDWPVSA